MMIVSSAPSGLITATALLVSSWDQERERERKRMTEPQRRVKSENILIYNLFSKQCLYFILGTRVACDPYCSKSQPLSLLPLTLILLACLDIGHVLWNPH